MMNRFIILFSLIPVLGFASTSNSSDVYSFPTDAQQRGYYNRPYERYEAEQNWCTTDGTFLQPSDDQKTLQSEASHQQAVQLVNQNSYVSWVVNRAGDGLTVRFSLPDNAEGTGTKGNIAIYAGTDQVGTMELNSYWAWQYCSDTYPTNNPNNGPVVRMKFDEMHLRLTRSVAQGETLKIVKTDNNATPYTIDFVELEPVPAKVTFESLSGDKVQFIGGNVGEFIMNNQGKTIYIPEGRWETERRIYLREADGTQVIGAGMWYTEIYYNAASDNPTTYSYRGIEADRSNLLVEGIYFNTINNQRYYNGNSNYQVGKGFMGSWGKNSVIRNCWVEHFECGAWLTDYSGRGTDNLLIEHCRFRNNYADGTNCSQGMTNVTLQYCSYRNNGDDDMASWTTATMCSGIKYHYCTAENNWRASSLGFFGGTNNEAHHIYIADALECGARVNADFAGAGFNGYTYLHDITIDHCGCTSGARGTAGDFWGSMQGAVNVGGTNYYDVKGITLENMTILNSREHGIMIRGGGKKLVDLKITNVAINNANNGLYFSSAKGNGTYCNIQYTNVTKEINFMPSQMTWAEDCATDLDEVNVQGLAPTANRFFLNGKLFIRVHNNLYDVTGRCVNPK
ncbi:MAG: hypothetical protein MJZ65_00935 [Paludibacteraceae bacterium]|nr:hypothetical protein [Paludibacteraceae bacterium]